MIKVFLGGTWNQSTWRDRLVNIIECDYFNPVVDDWTPECMDEELKQRRECDYCLYVITPKMTGVYSVAEVVDDSNKRPRSTIFYVMQEDDGKVFTEGQLRSLKATGDLVRGNGAFVCHSLREVARILNHLNLKGD